MLARDLRFARAPGDGQVEIQNPSSREAASFEVVPTAKHFRGDAKILGDRLHRIAFAHLVVGDGMGVGAGIALFAGGDGDDQSGFGRERIAIQSLLFRSLASAMAFAVVWKVRAIEASVSPLCTL